MSFSQPVCFVLLFQQSFSSSLPEVWPSTDLFGSPYLSYSLSFSLSLFILIPPLSRPSSASSSFTRYVSADGIEASHLFNFRDPASFIFIHGTSYTSLISQASEQPRIASYPPPPMRWEGHRHDREPEGEIRKRERKREREREREKERESGLSFRHHEVEGLAPRGLRYSPDIERSKPSHHWNYQSLPLLPFPLYSAFPFSRPTRRTSSTYTIVLSPSSSILQTKPDYLRAPFFRCEIFSAQLYYIAIVLLRCSV